MKHPSRGRAVLGFVLVAVVAAAGCKKEQPPAEATKEGAAKALTNLADKLKQKVNEAKNVATDDRKSLSADEYEKLILALSACELKKNGVDYKCEAYKAYRKARSRNTMLKGMAGMFSKLGLKHLNNENPTVRYIAAGLLKSIFGSKAEAQAAVLKAVETEKHPLVLARMISAVASAGKKNPKVAEMVLKMADHPEERVRLEAVRWLTSSWYTDVKGGLDKVITMITKDASPKVQAAACKDAGRSGDERLLPLYKKLTAKPDKDPKLYSSCMQGLMEMWNPFLTRDAPLSGKAYKLTMARMNDKPRTKERPPWMIMRHFGRTPKNDPKWYKEGAVKKMLHSVAMDGKVRWLARTGAVDALGKLKAKPELEKIQKALGSMKNPDFKNKQVLKSVERQLAKL